MMNQRFLWVSLVLLVLAQAPKALFEGDPGFDVIELPAQMAVMEERPEELSPQGIILHSMGVDLEKALKILRGESGFDVSAHFFIPQISGREFVEKFELEKALKHPDQVPVIQLVAPEKVAYHAGKSTWSDWNTCFPECERGLNKITLGIEVHCPGYANGLGSEETWDFDVFKPFQAAQKETVLSLVKALSARYEINAHSILAHSSIAPGRKTDPGPLFFWKELADAGYGLCVDPEVLQDKPPLTDEEAKNLVALTHEHLEKIGFPKVTDPMLGEGDDFELFDPAQLEESYGEQICCEEIKAQLKSYFLHYDPAYWAVFSAGTDSHEDHMQRLIRGVRSLFRPSTL